jgi:hypothetical protein
MGLLDRVRSLFTSDERKSDTTKDLRALLVASMEIVGAYGEIVEKHCGNATLTLKLPETLLPYPKETIAQAIANVQHAISNPSLHPMIGQVMEPEAAARVLSPDFRKFLNEGLAILSFFVPPSEADSDRKRWEELLPVLDKLGPDARARYEHLFKGPHTPEDKKSDR